MNIDLSFSFPKSWKWWSRIELDSYEL